MNSWTFSLWRGGSLGGRLGLGLAVAAGAGEAPLDRVGTGGGGLAVPSRTPELDTAGGGPGIRLGGGAKDAGSLSVDSGADWCSRAAAACVSFPEAFPTHPF